MIDFAKFQLTDHHRLTNRAENLFNVGDMNLNKSKKLELNQGTIRLIELALVEDLGPGLLIEGDITTSSTIDSEALGEAELVAKEELVVCGHTVATAIFAKIDSSVSYTVLHPDGARVSPGTTVATITGKQQALLVGERLSLNFFQRMSGIATATAKYVEIAGSKVQLLDTRKTTPGLRQLEKYAVTVGGGFNHRIGLYDEVLIKNNHIDAAGGDVARAIELCRSKNAPGTVIEVEVRDMNELEQAVSAKPDIILLDNYSPEEIRVAIYFIRSKDLGIKIEASGGINESNLKAYAETGVDRISLGALTHSVRSVDLSMRITG